MNKLEKCFIRAGLKKTESRILVWLMENEKGTSLEIERGVNARQPEVSIAVIKFCKKGWLTCKNIQHEGKGRPYNFYTIKKKAVISDIAQKFEEKMKNMEECTKLLEEYRNV